MRTEECIICGAPLEYLERETPMECAVCHKIENSRTRCVSGHYVCNDCHMAGLDAVVGLCLRETSRSPIAILQKMMDQPFCHMHGPEHHVMAGAALLTAYHNAGGALDLTAALDEMLRRGREVPGGACGFWGACGAGISTGIAVSILSGATPLAERSFGQANRMTSRALGRIGAVGGPRCCKRNCFLSLLAAVELIREEFGVALEADEPVCRYSAHNNQCIGARCPFCAGRSASDGA